MPEPLKITLIVVGILAGLWLLLLIVDLIFVGSYLTIFRKHKKAMTVILYAKLENLKKLISIMKQSGVDADNRIVMLLNDIGDKDFAEPGSEIFEKSKNTLSYAKDELMFVINQNKDLLNNQELVQAKNNVVESDGIYRNNVTMYNADVLGYNYWIRFLPCRFVFLIFRVKKKQLIRELL